MVIVGKANQQFSAYCSPFSLCKNLPQIFCSQFPSASARDSQIHIMDIISQLQEQVNTIAFITLNTFGTLQRDAPPVRLSPSYPEPPVNPSTNPSEETPNTAEQAKLMSAALVQAAKKFDALVAALPLSGGEEAQLKRIEELQAENESVGQDLQKQLEAAEQELKRVRELFDQAADNCLNLRRPD